MVRICLLTEFNLLEEAENREVMELALGVKEIELYKDFTSGNLSL